MYKAMQRLIEGLVPLPPPVAAMPGRWIPPVNISRIGDEIIIAVELAGVKKEDISIVVEGQVLHISGVRHVPTSKNSACYLLMEIEHGPFERLIKLPFTPSKAKASLEKGLLTINLKDEKKDLPVKIEVK